MDPKVLLVDEPTSGLSSKDSELLMDLLKQMTYSGTLVIAVIHQPSGDIFRSFDALVGAWTTGAIPCLRAGHLMP